MKKSDVLNIIRETQDPYSEKAPDGTSYPATGSDGSMETSDAATLTGTAVSDVEHPFNESTIGKIEKAEQGVKKIETKMKTVLADYKAADGDDKKPFIAKLKELTAEKKEAEKELEKVRDDFESQEAPEDEVVAETINEEMTRADKSDIKKMITKEIETTLKSKGFKDKVSDAVTKDVKKNKELEKVVVEITRNVVTQLYKVLWMRRTFWRNSLKNVPA